MYISGLIGSDRLCELPTIRQFSASGERISLVDDKLQSSAALMKVFGCYQTLLAAENFSSVAIVKTALIIIGS
ncbi:hypothetical protein ACLUXS_10035 [Limosilactobacillus mucosae]